MREDTIYEQSGDIRQELGYRDRIDLDEAFRRTIAWEREHFPEEIEHDKFDYEAEEQVLSENGAQ